MENPSMQNGIMNQAQDLIHVDREKMYEET
jgi:hypothetical protein